MGKQTMNEQENIAISRRELMKTSALALGATLAGGALLRPNMAHAQEMTADEEKPMTGAEPTTTEPDTTEPAMDADMAQDDIATLNSALGLEYLLHDLYLRAADANTIGEGKRVYLRARLGQLAPAMRDNKARHIVSLSEMIGAAGGEVVERRAYNFPSDVFISPIAFSGFSAALEEIACGACLGALNSLQSRDARAAGASLFANASRHAALVRMAGGLEFSPRYFEGALSTQQVQQLIAPYLA